MHLSRDRSPSLPPDTRVRYGWALALLVGLAFALRSLHLNWGLPEVFEEATSVRQALEMWGKPGGSLDLNPHFFKYPSLTIYLNFAMQLIWYAWLGLSGAVNSLNEFRGVLGQGLPQAVAMGRWLQAVLGALVVVPAALLGTQLAGPRAGLLAAALVAILPALLRESRMVSPDMALSLFAAASMAACGNVVTRGDRRDSLWSGLWAGLATASKYPGALLLVPLGLAHAIRAHRGRGAAPTTSPASGFFQAFSIAVVVFAALSPYVVLDARTALADILFERRHMVMGHLGREEGRALGFYLGTAFPRGLTVGVALAAVGGLAWLLGRRATRSLALPGFAFFVVTLGLLGSWRMAAPRYVLPLAVLASVWSAALVVGPAARFRAGVPRTVAQGLLGLLLLAAPFIVSAREVRGRDREDSRLAAAQWIEAHVPAGSALLVERYGPEPDPEKYLVLYLPFHGITPHIYDGAYSPPLYATFDYVVLSSQVHGRYLARPREYPAQVALYATLDRAFEEVAVFEAGEYLGPTLRILRRRGEPGIRELSGIPPAFFDAHRGNAPLAEYLSALGTVLVRQGRDDLGFRILTEATAMDPENAKALGNLGAMYLRRGRLEDALTALRRASEKAPQDAGIAFDLGALFARMGERSQAADAYRKAVSLDPGLESAYVALARVLIEDDRYGEARLILEGFLDRFPRSSRRAAAEAALAELRQMGPGRP